MQKWKNMPIAKRDAAVPKAQNIVTGFLLSLRHTLMGGGSGYVRRRPGQQREGAESLWQN
jgi:hypothetical protein